MPAFDALETQISLLKYWESSTSRPEQLWIDRDVNGSSGIGATVRQMLTYASTFYVTEEITGLLNDSLSTLPPSLTLAQASPPVVSGFVFAGDGFASLGYEGFDESVRAFGWAPIKTKTILEKYKYVEIAVPDEYIFVWFGEVPGRRGVFETPLRVIGQTTWPIGENWLHDWGPVMGGSETEAATIKAESGEAMEAMRGFALGFFAFCQQKLVRLQNANIPRSTRRRASIALPMREPLVNVIQLRRFEGTAVKKGGGVQPDWSCRWLVSPHWRNQYFPSMKGNRPIWINGYVKGPDDKPLRRKKIELFSVSR